MLKSKLQKLIIPATVVGMISFACNTEQVEVSKKNNPIPVVTAMNAEPTLQLLEKQLESDSLNIKSRLKLASEYYKSKDFEKAIFYYLKIFKFDNKNLTAITSLGNLYYDTHLNEKAIEFYEKSLAIDNKNINVRCDMATCYLNLKKSDVAIKILKENIEIDANHAQSHHNLAVIYNQIGEKKKSDEEMAIFNKLKVGQ